MWGAILGGAADLASSLFGSSSADRANRANIKLAREQRAWEEKMSDSAVRRRAEDIRLAGGNPALAFTGGQSASTPSVSAPTVEPTFRPEWAKGSVGTAALMAAQLDQLKATTQNTSADTKKKNIESQIMEEITGPSSAADYVAKTQKNAMFETEFRKLMAEADLSEETVKLFRDKGPALLRLLAAQGGLAEADLQSTREMLSTFGVNARDSGTVAGMIKSAASVVGSGWRAAKGALGGAKKFNSTRKR